VWSFGNHDASLLKRENWHHAEPAVAIVVPSFEENPTPELARCARWHLPLPRLTPKPTGAAEEADRNLDSSQGSERVS